MPWANESEPSLWNLPCKGWTVTAGIIAEPRTDRNPGLGYHHVARLAAKGGL